MSDTKDLTLLGSNNTVYETHYTPNILEKFENQFPQNTYVVELECPEFTHICPKTAQPAIENSYRSDLADYVPIYSKGGLDRAE